MERKVGDIVTLPKGKQIGMRTLKADTQTTVTHILNRDDGGFYHRVIWTDNKGREKSTYTS